MSATVIDGHADHHGKVPVKIVKDIVCRMEGSLGIEGIEDGLKKQQVDTTLHQGFNLLAICSVKLVIGDSTCCRIVDIGRKGGRGVRRADIARHIASTAHTVCHGGFGSLTGQTDCGKVELAHKMCTMVVGQGNALCRECIRSDDIGSGFQIAAMYVENDIGTRQ